MAWSRLRTFACLVAATMAVLAVAPAGHAREPGATTDRGVVQTVAPQRLVVRALDGSDLEFLVDTGTRVVLNGVRARLAAIRPGFVAEVVHQESGRALRIRAFGQIAGTERGVIVSRGQGELRLQRADGIEIAVALTRRTRIRRNGVLLGRWALRPGRRATVVFAENGSARLVVLGRRRL
jgi:hypothetical protein